MASGAEALSLSLQGIDALDPVTGRFVPTDLTVKDGRYAQDSEEKAVLEVISLKHFENLLLRNLR